MQRILPIALGGALVLGMPVAGFAQPASSSAPAQTDSGAHKNALTTRLAPVSVEGRLLRQSWDPVDGYVADHSATATKTDIPLIESPQSVAVIGRQELEDRGADSLTEAVNYSAGITNTNVIYDNPLDSINILVRGFQASNALYHDGSRNYAGLPYDAPTEIYGLERIEVLKGPSSVLYGQGDPGGVINLVTKRPTATPLREFGAEFGSYHHKQLTGDIGNAIDADAHWRYRLTGLVEDSDSVYDYTDSHRVYIAPALTWEPNDRSRVTLLTHYQKNDAVYHWAGFPLEGRKYDNDGRHIPQRRYIGIPGADGYDSELYSAGYLYTQKIGRHFTFDQNVRYRKIKYDVTDVFRDYSVADPLSDDLTTLARSMRIRHDDGSTVTADNRLVGEFSHGAFDHQALVGFDYKHIDYDSLGTSYSDPSANVPPLNLYHPDYNPPYSPPTGFTPRSTKANQYGVYLQEHLRYADHWALTVGGRQDWVDETSLGADHNRQDNFSWRAGLVYLADNGLAPYVSYSESFSPQYGVNDFTGKKYEPISGNQYEAGLRYRPTAFDARFSLAAFQLTRENELVADPQQPVIQRQIGETRSRGIEASARFDLTAGLSAIASYTYDEVEVVEAGGDQAINGKRVPNRPDHLARLWLNYDFQRQALNGLSLGGGVRYTSSSYAEAANTAHFPSTTLVDASASYAFDHVRLQVTANNLFDQVELYCSGHQPNSLCSYGVPRQVIGSITYRWD